MHRFEAEIESVNDGRGAAIALPFDPKAAFGRARAPVRVVVGEHEAFRTTVAVYGGVGWIGLRKGQLAEMGVGVGDRVSVRVEVDEEPREVSLPDELAATLAGDADAAARYDALSFTHRKEYARWVGSGKRAETRQRRAEKAVEMLRDGVRTPG